MTTCEWDGERGTLRPLQIISTLRTSFTGNSTAAELAVAPSGAFVYASNRGSDDIAVYAVDQATGVAERGGVGADPRQAPAFHRPHAVRTFPLRRQ